MSALIKAVLCVLICLMAGAAFTVFAASSATALAAQLARDAQLTDSLNVKRALLDRAEATLTRDWTQSPHWHAGAAETLSAIYYARGGLENAPADDFAASAHYAQAAVRLSPALPHAWIRLAALAEQGHANAVCSAAQCLEHSWRYARMLTPEAACARLQLAGRANLLTPDDPRIVDYLRSGVSRRTATTCLAPVFPPDIVFRLGMDAAPPS